MTLEQTQEFIRRNAAAAVVFGDYYLTPNHLAAIVELAYLAGEVQHSAEMLRRFDDAVIEIELDDDVTCRIAN